MTGFLGQPLEAPEFLVVLAQPGSARWLKEELAREHPELRNSYARKGVYTFKANEPLSESFALRSVFARHWAYSLGTVAHRELAVRLGELRGPLRLFVSAREPGEPDAEALVAQVRAELLQQLPELFLAEPTPQLGDLVLDIVVGEHDREPWVVGLHRHGAGKGSDPGGVAPARVPDEAPSRAWGKLAEALTWSGLSPSAGDHAVEVGAAPGGAAALLLSRGVHVTGIDPGDMDHGLGRWSQDAVFTHLQKPVGAVQRAELPERAQWLLCDANLAPRVALHYLERLVAQLRPHLRALVFTIKLNDERVVADLPTLLGKLSRLGETRATQLPSHRREVVAVVRFSPG